MKYSTDVNSGLAISNILSAAIAHQTAHLWKFARVIDCGYCVTGRQLDDFVGKTYKQRIAAHNETVCASLTDGCKGRVNLLFAGRLLHV